MELVLNPNDIADYERFLAIKRLPKWSIRGCVAWFPDEYADAIGVAVPKAKKQTYRPSPFLFDYQRDISRMAINKRKMAVFLECGLGKTAVLLEFARHAAKSSGKPVLITSPLMVIPQTIAEATKFYGGAYPIHQVRAADLGEWMVSGSGVGITNYEAIRDELEQGNLGGLVLDESSMLKSHYGKWGTKLIELGKGLDWKLCLTGTPAPNDRIEYANHAVFLDAFPTVNSFLARFFINRGETQERWVLKPHALETFYRELSHWAIFVSNPGVYGWKDNAATIPPIHVHIHDVQMTAGQAAAVIRETGQLIPTAGGIVDRMRLGQIAKGNLRGEAIDTEKPAFIRDLVNGFGGESTIIWCVYNAEQDAMAATFPDAASISGDTPEDERVKLIDEFKSGRRKVLISKPKILGFGLNLQVATRMVFSGLQDSYESYYQAVKRANRVGSTRPLNVHIPITEIERSMVETVIRKAAMVESDTREQERIFKTYGATKWN